jgi:hypothetical protein
MMMTLALSAAEICFHTLVTSIVKLAGIRSFQQMTKARQVFESLMQSKGKQVYWNGKKYTNVNIQTKWRYFLIGWNMKETHNGT